MDKLINEILDSGLLKFLPQKMFLKIKYRYRFGQKLNFDNPVTFNEKLQWLKVYGNYKKYTFLADKYEVKDFVKEKIGDKYLIPTIGIYNKFDDIDFSALPPQFVLKCTHDSGGVVICKDKSKIDFDKAKRKINKSLRRNFYYNGREPQYRNIKPRIIVEKYMEDKTSTELSDYKLFCFNGVPRVILVCKDRYKTSGLTEDFFDVNWNHLDIKRPKHGNSKEKIDKPKKIDEMIKLAKVLSTDIPFVRVDFYEINEKVYFGELTFFPAGGLQRFIPEEWDEKMGNWLVIPKNKLKGNRKNEK